jgi:hypothetical protein
MILRMLSNQWSGFCCNVRITSGVRKPKENCLEIATSMAGRSGPRPLPKVWVPDQRVILAEGCNKTRPLFNKR